MDFEKVEIAASSKKRGPKAKKEVLEVSEVKVKTKKAPPKKKKKVESELILVMEPQTISSPHYFDEDLKSENEDSDSKKSSMAVDIICHNCDRFFNTKIEFELHYQKEYNQEPIYVCMTCNKKIQHYKAFRVHTYRHYNSMSERYKCTICSKGFMQTSDLKTHELTHAIKKTKIIKCKKCTDIFETNESYKEHVKVHSNKQATECPDCGKILMSSGSLYSHRKIHEENPKYACEECDRKFVQKINFIHHLKKHLNDRPYSCTQCDKAFFEKSHLQRHQNFHSLARPFKCDNCGKAYKTERCLKVHSAVHSDQRPFVCPECNKGFLSSSKLKQHSNIHTGARPFKCKYCERTFTNFPNWLKHIRRRHKVDHRTGEKLDSVPQFMTKKKDTNNRAKVKAAPKKQVAAKKIHLNNDHNLQPIVPEMERYKPDEIILINESSNIDLNLVSKDDLIQPLPDELDMMMQIPDDDLEMQCETYQNELFKTERFECDLSECILNNGASDDVSNNLVFEMKADEKPDPPREVYNINNELSIFPTIISIFNEQQFQYINPNFLHDQRHHQLGQVEGVKMEFSEHV